MEAEPLQQEEVFLLQQVQLVRMHTTIAPGEEMLKMQLPPLLMDLQIALTTLAGLIVMEPIVVLPSIVAKQTRDHLAPLMLEVVLHEVPSIVAEAVVVALVEAEVVVVAVAEVAVVPVHDHHEEITKHF